MQPDLAIRLATPEDIDEVMPMAIKAAEENAAFDASSDLLLQEVWPALNLDHGLCAVIGPVGGRIEGMVILRIGTFYYTHQPCIEEKVVWVDPDFRSAQGGRAGKLVQFSKHVADTLGLKLVIGILSTNRTEAKVRLYQRLLGPPSGAYWLYGGDQKGTIGHEVKA